MKKTDYKVSDVEELIGLQRRAIQFYTQEGVIKPLSGGGKRGQACIYSRENMIEFGIIKQLAAFGMTIQKIKKIISEFKKPQKAGFDRYRRRIIRSKDGKLLNPYVTFYFNSDINDDDFLAVYEPGSSKKWIVSSKETLSQDGKIKYPGMDDYESCLVINIGKIIEKVGD